MVHPDWVEALAIVVRLFLCWIEYQAEVGTAVYVSQIVKWGRDSSRNSNCSLTQLGVPSGNLLAIMRLCLS